MRWSSSFKLLNNREETDLSWVQSLVKKSPPEKTRQKLVTPSTVGASATDFRSSNAPYDSTNHAALAALHQKQLFAQ